MCALPILDAPKFAGDTNSEDFILMPCGEWCDETQSHYQYLNQDWRFFETSQLQRYEQMVTQFVPPKRPDVFKKVGRNEACPRSEEHTSELQSLMRISYAVFCLKKKKKQHTYTT